MRHWIKLGLAILLLSFVGFLAYAGMQDWVTRNVDSAGNHIFGVKRTGEAVLINGEEIDNTTDGTVAITDGTNTFWQIDDTGTMNLNSTSAGATGTTIEAYQDSSSPAASDSLFGIAVYGNDSGGNKTEYGAMGFIVEDPTNGSEDGGFGITLMVGGTLQADKPDFSLSGGTAIFTHYNDGTDGADVRIRQDSASPAASDKIAMITSVGNDDGGNETEYSKTITLIGDPADGSESAVMQFYLQNGTGSLPTDPQLQINGSSGAISVNRDDDAAEGATVQLYQNSASPANADEVGYVKFVGNDDGGNVQEYAQIAGSILDPADTSEDGVLIFKVASASSVNALVKMQGDKKVVISGSVQFDDDGSNAGVGLVNAPAQIDSAGTDLLTVGTDNQVQRYDFAAGGGAYTYNIDLDDTNAYEGAAFYIYIHKAASANPTINVRNKSGGSNIISLNNGNEEDYGCIFVFDGTDWQKLIVCLNDL